MSFKPVMNAEAVAALWDEHFPQVETMGDVAILDIRPGEAVLRFGPDERHLRPGRTVSGPALVTLADLAAYAVLLAHIGPEPLILTTGISMNFLRRARPAPLLATGRILKLGRRLAVVEIGLRQDEEAELVAHATATYAIPPNHAVP
jgi:uncharacterized protein (TIGR00369 family)